jgi:hypothetical protein
LKISTAVIIGILFGLAAGLTALGKVNAVSPEIQMDIHNYAGWVVLLCLLFPLVDYLSGVRTTVTGIVARHPYRHLAGFFTGLALGLEFLILVAGRLAF